MHKVILRQLLSLIGSMDPSRGSKHVPLVHLALTRVQTCYLVGDYIKARSVTCRAVIGVRDRLGPYRSISI
jgi:hypothetical protein